MTEMEPQTQHFRIFHNLFKEKTGNTKVHKNGEWSEKPEIKQPSQPEGICSR